MKLSHYVMAEVASQMCPEPTDFALVQDLPALIVNSG